MKRLVCLMLVMVMFAGMGVFALADDFQLRNGILFGDSEEVVRNKETLEIGEYSSSERDDGTKYIYSHDGMIAGFDDADVKYFFKDNEMYDMEYCFYTDKENYKTIYDTLYKNLSKKYGNPIKALDDGHFIKTEVQNVDNYLLLALAAYDTGIADLSDVDEWVVKCDDYYVKIEMRYSYYAFKSSKDLSYTVYIDYMKYTDDDLTIAIEQAANDAAAAQADLEAREASLNGDL